METINTESSSPPSDCAVCGFTAPSIRKLKSHLLLKHPNLHMCLFCVEKKGWSDTFASAAQYNDHYWHNHRGAIQKRAADASAGASVGTDESDRRKKRRSSSASTRDVCLLCDDRPVFASGTGDLDRHRIAAHGFDYCKECSMIGPSAAVRYHICQEHPNTLCYICASASPVFKGGGSEVQRHMRQCHGLVRASSQWPCFDCHAKPTEEDNETVALASVEALMEHLLRTHLTKADVLVPMRKRFRRDDESVAPTEEESIGLKHIVGIRNETGNDCFAIASLHLLAQTDLFSRMEISSRHASCRQAACLVGNFLQKYLTSGKRSPAVSLGALSTSYTSSLGLSSLPVDVGDFLRALISQVDATRIGHTGNKDVRSLFQVALQWKFECVSCRRFMVMSLDECVVTLSCGSRQDSLRALVDDFLHVKTCCVCSAVNTRVPPTVRHVPDYILLEIDRAVQAPNEDEVSKELNIYSLQLEPAYDLFGFRYTVLGTINYHLEADGGGHYITMLFPTWGSGTASQCTWLHEDNVRTIKRKPDFDSATVIVALKKGAMTAADMGRVDINAEASSGTDLMDRVVDEVVDEERY